MLGVTERVPSLVEELDAAAKEYFAYARLAIVRMVPFTETLPDGAETGQYDLEGNPVRRTRMRAGYKRYLRVDVQLEGEEHVTVTRDLPAFAWNRRWHEAVRVAFAKVEEELQALIGERVIIAPGNAGLAESK